MDKDRIAKIAQSKAYVMGHIDPRTGLEQLSEELNEMSQAALKLIRAAGWNGNPTPVSYENALRDLNEEFEDVLMCLEVMTEIKEGESDAERRDS